MNFVAANYGSTGPFLALSFAALDSLGFASILVDLLVPRATPQDWLVTVADATVTSVYHVYNTATVTSESQCSTWRNRFQTSCEHSLMTVTYLQYATDE